MARKFGCHTFSFDPFVDLSPTLADLISSNTNDGELSSSFEIQINEKWRFYRLGITSENFERSENLLNSKLLKVGDLLGIGGILKLTKLEEKVIDVLKINIESEEMKHILGQLDMDYMCEYVKQLVFVVNFNVLRFVEVEKLEECFFLFHRSTRFSQVDGCNVVSEFQSSYRIDLKRFADEVDLAQFMFTNGQLYFMNSNFFKETF